MYIKEKPHGKRGVIEELMHLQKKEQRRQTKLIRGHVAQSQMGQIKLN